MKLEGEGVQPRVIYSEWPHLALPFNFGGYEPAPTWKELLSRLIVFIIKYIFLRLTQQKLSTTHYPYEALVLEGADSDCLNKNHLCNIIVCGIGDSLIINHFLKANFFLGIRFSNHDVIFF
jgi:hypothetical protein